MEKCTSCLALVFLSIIEAPYKILLQTCPSSKNLMEDIILKNIVELIYPKSNTSIVMQRLSLTRLALNLNKPAKANNPTNTHMHAHTTCGPAWSWWGEHPWRHDGPHYRHCKHKLCHTSSHFCFVLWLHTFDFQFLNKLMITGACEVFSFKQRPTSLGTTGLCGVHHHGVHWTWTNQLQWQR